MISDSSEGTDGGRPKMRPIRFGDHVEKGQLLAVLWSSELGEKKSEYVDALSATAARAGDPDQAGGPLQGRGDPRAEPARGPPHCRGGRDRRRPGRTDPSILATHRRRRSPPSAPRPSRSARELPRRAAPWRSRGPGSRCAHPWREPSWRRTSRSATSSTPPPTSSRSPTSASCGSGPTSTRRTCRPCWPCRNRSAGPSASSPTRRPRRWPGTVEQIGDIIDPNQHTALVIGQVDNPEGGCGPASSSRPTVELPPHAGRGGVPTTALVEDGEESVVFVQPDPRQPSS